MIELQTDQALFGGVFQGKKVLVTGHTGFKGAWIALWLHSLGASVVGYALEPPTAPNLFGALSLGDTIVDIKGDVRDRAHLSSVFQEHKPDIVFHMAAQPLVRYSYAEPHLTYETNVIGTVNLFEAVRGCPGVRVVVNITSDKCYDNQEWAYAYRENDPMGGFDPYSSSKGCAELVASAYRNSFFRDSDVRLASVRAGNVVGGGDWAEDRIVPDSIRALSAGEPIVVRNPRAIRPWQHVLEPLSGYLWLASRLWPAGYEFDGAWNFGPSAKSNVTVERVVEKIIAAWGSGEWKGPENPIPQPHEAAFLKLDCTKANNQLGWHPIYDIDETLKITTEWYRAFYRRERTAHELSLGDIQGYVRKARDGQLAWAGSEVMGAV